MRDGARTGKHLIGDSPLDEEGKRSRQRLFQAGQPPPKLHAVGAGPAHSRRFQAQASADLVQIVSAQAHRVHSEPPTRLLQHPLPEGARDGIGNIHNCHQLEVGISQWDYSIRRSVTLMTSSLDRSETLAFYLVDGLIQVLDAENEVIDSQTHPTILARRLRIRRVRRFSPILVIATLGAIALALFKGSKEGTPPPESWSPVDPS